jgi:SNF2 family DNA or RNA helicase
MPHQIEGANFAASKPYAGIFYEYGTGKTLIALMVINALKLARTLVVSTKLSVKSVWPSEIRQHTNFRWVTLVGGRRKKGRLLQHGMKASMPETGKYHAPIVKPTVFLVNYDGIKNIYRELIKCPWDCIILDESTKIKSPNTKRTLVMWDLAKKISRRYIMTGFPVTENLADLYAQIKFLDDSNLLGSSYYAFLNTYFVKMGMKTLPKKKKTRELLEKIAPFCIHKTNEMLKLPPKIYKKLDIELTAQQKKLLDDFKSTFRLELGKVKIDTQYVFALITKSLEICDGYIKDEKGNIAVIPTNKDEALIEVLDEIDARHNKAVIWAAHRFSIRKVDKYLRRLGYGVLTLTGETENEDLVIQRFQHDKRYTILLATQKKAAESVTLTAAKYGIYYSNTWSYDLRANSEARIRRKGSEGHASIVYTDLVTEDSIESKVYECLRKKGNLLADLKAHFKQMKDGSKNREEA